MTLYNIHDRRMNKHEAPVEWHWQRKLKYSDKNLSQCHFVHNKFQMDRPGIEPSPKKWQANKLPEPWHKFLFV
jgi:hypothetical protein